MMNRHLLTALCTLLSFFLAAQTQAPDRLTPEKLWHLGRVSLFDVSPDGKTAVYGVSYYDIEANKGNRDLYSVSTDGSGAGKPLQLTNFEGNENDAQYRPDGRKIGFLRGDKLWEINPDGTGAKQVSDIGMNGFHYSPDGSKILFARDVKYDKTTQDKYPDLQKTDAKIIDGLMYRHWDEWEDGSYSNLFVANYSDGEITSEMINIMGQPYDSPLKPFGGMEQVAWSPNGQYIAYTCKKLGGTEAAVSTNSDVYLYDLLSMNTRNLTQGMNGYDMNPAFSPDGRMLAWESQETPGYEADRHRIFIYDFTTDKKMEVTVGYDNDATSPQWGHDGKRIYFGGGSNGTDQLFYIDLGRGNEVVQVSSGQFDFGPFVVGKNNIVAARCSMSEPHELFALPFDNGRSTQLTYTNKEMLNKLNFGKVEKRMVKTTDGKDMLTWVIYPPNFDPSKKYPTLLYCQGGPQSTVSQFWSYRWNFQMMAANDYIVVAPNRRGLPSFGQQWNAEISGDWGGQAMQDYLSAIDDVSKETYVDKNNLGAVGASFGGYSVFWLAGNHKKRFKAFIAHDGVFNLESMYGTTEELFFVNHDLAGSYWQTPLPETWKLDSPHKYVQNWDTPILVIQGGKDFRVPESEGMQAFQAAQLRGIPSRFLYFPDENHWVLKPQNGILWQREFFGWLDRWLKGKP
ncbi:MAG: S9 family peptidase [Lewinellaceae bacterium]|nr:S9 family peptidase [Saprospiraceae bacterium]MCB9340488.1 S9 family peptidase [Lewinellaceae bacterium]